MAQMTLGKHDQWSRHSRLILRRSRSAMAIAALSVGRECPSLGFGA
jgi:hypothetical protein